MSSPADSNTEISNLNLDQFEVRVISATHREQLRDILVLIYDELSMRRHGYRWGVTGFETATYYDLRRAFYRTVNQMILM